MLYKSILMIFNFSAFSSYMIECIKYYKHAYEKQWIHSRRHLLQFKKKYMYITHKIVPIYFPTLNRRMYNRVAQDKCGIFVVQSGPKLLADIISLFYMCVKHVGSRSENWFLIITMSIAFMLYKSILMIFNSNAFSTYMIECIKYYKCVYEKQWIRSRRHLLQFKKKIKVHVYNA